MLAIIVSLLVSCTTTSNRQGNWRGGQNAHFSQKTEINKDGAIKQVVVRKPNLQKLKIFTPNIVKAQGSNKEKTTTFIKEDINFKKVADIVEKEKPYDRASMIMFWLAILSSSILVWCSVWFVGRSLLK